VKRLSTHQQDEEQKKNTLRQKETKNLLAMLKSKGKKIGTSWQPPGCVHLKHQDYQ